LPNSSQAPSAAARLAAAPWLNYRDNLADVAPQHHILCSAKQTIEQNWTVFLTNLLTAAATAFADWRRRQRAYDELIALDDHCLADLGIERAQINAYLAEGRRKERRVTAAAETGPGARFRRHEPA
jgi:uncharacterized protein YjiS (DUF1127 family)